MFSSAEQYSLLKAINQAQEHYIGGAKTEKEIFYYLLDTLLDITQSEYGFIGRVFYHPEKQQPYLKTIAVTNIAWNDYTRQFYEQQESEGMEFYNLKTLFGEVMVTQNVVIANHPPTDPRAGGTPKGHPPLNAFLGIPLLINQKIIGMIGIANRPDGYSEEIVQFLTPFTNTCTVIIQSLTFQREKEAENNNYKELYFKQQELNEELSASEAELRATIESYIEVLEKFRQSEQKLKEASRISKIGYWEWNVKTTDIFWSDEVYEILKIRDKSFKPTIENFFQFVHPEDAPMLQQNLDRTQSENQIVASEYRMIDIEGGVHYIFTEGYSVKNDNEEVISFFGVLKDITKEKQAIEEIRYKSKTLQDFRTALDSSTILAITDKKGIIVEVNNAFCIISGYSKEELLGNSHQIINSGYHDKEFFARMWRQISKGKIWKGEVKNKAKNGRYYWVDTTIVPILDDTTGKPEQYLAIRIEITRRKQAEELLNQQNQQFRNYAFITSHELRKPLANILGLISLFNEEDPTDGFNLEIIKNLYISAQELDGVIHKMNKALEQQNDQEQLWDTT
ncbi:MAG: PAS domain S-box protein [Cytophagales bacterium]|nr:MAG: PAS domain S-box protein [Cytophagales bacterium]